MELLTTTVILKLFVTCICKVSIQYKGETVIWNGFTSWILPLRRLKTKYVQLFHMKEDSDTYIGAFQRMKI